MADQADMEGADQLSRHSWLRSFLFAALAGWATAVLITALSGVGHPTEYHFPLSGRPREDATIVAITLLTYFLLAALLLLIVAAFLWLARLKRPWAYVLAVLPLPIVLTLIFPPAVDDLIFVVSPALIITLAVWGLLNDKVLLTSHARLRATGHVLIAAVSLAAVAILIYSHLWVARANEAAASTPPVSPIGARMMGGVATGRELLMYNWMGALVSNRIGDWTPKVVAPTGVVSVVQDSSGIWTMSLPRLPDNLRYDDPLRAGQFTVSRYQAGALLPTPPGSYEADDRPVALLVSNGAPVVVGRKKLYKLDGRRNIWTATTLIPSIDKLPGDITASAAVPSGSSKLAYLAFNVGEFGGGILNVDLETGKTRKIERRDSNEICAGPLNADCDPVTGIIADPWRPSCVLASIGLRHMLEHGRLVRVCDGSVEVVSEITSRSVSTGRQVRRFFGQNPKSAPPFSEAFFGLVVDRSGVVWTASTRAVYRYDGHHLSAQKMPNMELHGDLRLTVKVPGLIILSTDMNARNSLSGSTPLLIPVL